MLDHKGMRESAGQSMSDLGIGTLQNMSQAVETLSGGQRQAVSVARAAAFATKLIVLDEPTAALGVKETNQVLSMINRVRESGLPVILISHNMPNVFEVADRIHIQRLGRCAGVVTPKSHTPNEVVAIMTGATTLEETPGKRPTSGARSGIQVAASVAHRHRRGYRQPVQPTGACVVSRDRSIHCRCRLAELREYFHSSDILEITAMFRGTSDEELRQLVDLDGFRDAAVRGDPRPVAGARRC